MILRARAAILAFFCGIAVGADPSSARQCVIGADASACLTALPALEAADGAAALESLLLSGRFDIASQLLARSRGEGVDLSTTLHQVSSRVRAALQKLADEQEKRKEEDAPIAPAFEWAQSVGFLHLNIKFAHRMDAPVTLGCEASPPTFSSVGVAGSTEVVGTNAVEFSAVCNAKRKRFTLRLLLSRNISAEASTWAAASVGRASLTLRKATDGPWPRLLAGGSKDPRTWWAMQVRRCGVGGCARSCALLCVASHRLKPLTSLVFRRTSTTPS